jgi:hypothetical protein
VDSVAHKLSSLTTDAIDGSRQPRGTQVFEGLRVVTSGGRVLSQISQRDQQPFWPAEVPAADWNERVITVHRTEENHVVAYLLSVPVTGQGDSVWLEAHVAAQDVPYVFAIPEHMMTGVESAVYDDTGGLLLVGHSHASEELLSLGSGVAVRPEGREDHDPAEKGEHEHDSGNPAIGQPVDHPASGIDARRTRRVEIGGIPYLTAAATIPVVDWVYLVAMPLPDALAPLIQLRRPAWLVWSS